MQGMFVIFLRFFAFVCFYEFVSKKFFFSCFCYC